MTRSISKSTHTPGPWRWMNEEALVADYGRRRAILTSNWTAFGLQTCGEDGLLRTLDIHEPNARLMAAAPDLLAVVKKLRHVIYVQLQLDPVDADCRSICEQADLAIAKAEAL